MAASTNDTSQRDWRRHGVAVLGAIVIGKLQTALVASLNALGLRRASSRS